MTHYQAFVLKISAAAVVFLCCHWAVAQVPRHMPITTTEKTTVFDGQARIEIKPALGVGFSNNYTGVDADNQGVIEPINVNSGGGLRLAAELGYTTRNRFDFSAGLGFQFINGVPQVSNATIRWTSFFTEPMVAYGIKLTDRKKINVGLGLHASIASALKIEADPAGTQPRIALNFGYGTNFGPVFKTEFENRFANRNTSFKAGIRLHWVESTLKTITQNGSNVPLSNLNAAQRAIYSTMPAGGVGAYAGICFYF